MATMLHLRAAQLLSFKISMQDVDARLQAASDTAPCFLRFYLTSNAAVLDAQHEHKRHSSSLSRQAEECSIYHINAFHWNPHAECFSEKFDSDGKCSTWATQQFVEALTGHFHHDFANMVYSLGKLQLPDDFSEHWGQIAANCPQQTTGQPIADDTILFYNRDRWRSLGLTRRGCMGADRRGQQRMRRPWVAEVFDKLSPPLLRVLVVAGHFPHWREYSQHIRELRSGLQDLMRETNVKNVMVLADTNQQVRGDRYDKSARHVLKDVGAIAKGKVERPAHSTMLFHSCCNNPGKPEDWSFAGYDRILANFGRRMKTHVPIPQDVIRQRGQRNMHQPVIGSLEVPCDCGDGSDGPCTGD
eukprot:TRINITY_DN94366_c0_g1_i1.p1 TRINITY_DN94366_c0_g1~~TRINITY_DN94366_c0_g1_i1.p1  ORF type:complete len:384 (+),score=42.47 TRINITY_DN94366_c0_g1_i1:81-1154(+)